MAVDISPPVLASANRCVMNATAPALSTVPSCPKCRDESTRSRRRYWLDLLGGVIGLYPWR